MAHPTVAVLPLVGAPRMPRMRWGLGSLRTVRWDPGSLRSLGVGHHRVGGALAARRPRGAVPRTEGAAHRTEGAAHRTEGAQHLCKEGHAHTQHTVYEGT